MLILNKTRIETTSAKRFGRNLTAKDFEILGISEDGIIINAFFVNIEERIDGEKAYCGRMIPNRVEHEVPFSEMGTVDGLYAQFLLEKGEVLKSYSEQRRSGMMLSFKDVSYKGETFKVMVSSVHADKVEARWDTATAGSSDGLRPDVVQGGVQVFRDDTAWISPDEVKRLKNLV